MKITPPFSIPPPFVDKVCKVKDWVYNATDVFVRFCTECIWHHLEQNHILQSHLQKINTLCITEHNSPLLEVHLTNICSILEKDPSLVRIYIDLALDIKDISPDLFKIYQIADRYPNLLKIYLQTITVIKRFKVTTPILEIYLRTIRSVENHPDNRLTKQICGAFISYQNLIQNQVLQDLFFKTIHHVWNLKKELTESYLQSMHNLCSFQPLTLESHLTINHLIYSNTQILETHLGNINHLHSQFLEDYINTSFGLKNNKPLLNLYIYTIHIIKNSTALDAHQQNTQMICKLQLGCLEAYFIMISYLENTNLLERYVHGIYNINCTKNSNLLPKHLQKMYSIYSFNKDLLEPHFQNICSSCLSLGSYLQNVSNTENAQDTADVIYSMYNITHISQSHIALLENYLVSCHHLENCQEKLDHNSNIYFISQKYSPLLKTYLKTTLFLENRYPTFSYLHIENVKNTFNHKLAFLKEYISTVNQWMRMNEEGSLLLYINYVYNNYFILQNHSELISLYSDSCYILASQQDDLNSHIYNISYISQKDPHLLKDYLESTLFLINTYSNLLWPHLQNTQNIYASNVSISEYISKICALKESKELLIIHICHPFNLYRLNQQHPSLISIYHFTSKALKNYPKSQAYHIHNTYRISIFLTPYLSRYLNIIQKIIPIWMSQEEPKCSWLNNHLQTIQRFSFEDATSLEKHLQLISQIDPIFEGRTFLVEEILNNMQEEERKEFISTSPEIMPYVIAKSIFLYGFHPKYQRLVPCFFKPNIQQEIITLRKEEHKYSHLKKIFTNFLDFINYWNQEMLEDDTRVTAKKIQNLWIDASKGENNLFMQAWKEAAKTLEI